MNNTIDMTSGKLSSKIIRFTIPIMITNLLQVMYNAADILVVGRFTGEYAVAAIGATSPIYNIIINFLSGISIGANICCASHIGAKDEKNVSKIVHSTICLSLLLGLLFSFIGISFSKPLLGLVNTPKEIVNDSLIYLRFSFAGSIAILLQNMLSAILRSKGDSKTSLIILSISGLLNVVLNLLFVAIFKLGVFGVAVATFISGNFSAIALLIHMIKLNDCCKINLRKLKLEIKVSLKIIKLGLPSGIESSLFAISQLVIQSAINYFGADMVAGNTAAGSIDTFSFQFFNAFYYTVISFVAQNNGALKYERVKQSYKLCMLFGMIAAFVSGGLIYIFGTPLLKMYLPNSDSAIIYGVTRLKYICIPYFVIAAMNVTLGALRGLGCVVTPTVISLIGSCGLRCLWIFWVFKMYPTPDTLFLSFPMTWLITFIASFVAYIIYMKKKIALAHNNVN